MLISSILYVRCVYHCDVTVKISLAFGLSVYFLLHDRNYAATLPTSMQYYELCSRINIEVPLQIDWK